MSVRYYTNRVLYYTRKLEKQHFNSSSSQWGESHYNSNENKRKMWRYSSFRTSKKKYHLRFTIKRFIKGKTTKGYILTKR